MTWGVCMFTSVMAQASPAIMLWRAVGWGPQAERAKAFNDRFLKNLGRLRSFIDHASEEYGLGGVDGPIDHYEAIQKATAEYLKEKGIDPA